MGAELIWKFSLLPDILCTGPAALTPVNIPAGRRDALSVKGRIINRSVRKSRDQIVILILHHLVQRFIGGLYLCLLQV